jgi:hypothetical protein
MATLYQALKGIHNLVGILALLAALITAVIMLATSSTQRGSTPLALRVSSIIASLQGLLGIVLIVLALVAFGFAYVGTFWFHYLLGLVSVALISIVAARARRAPDGAARTFGGLLLGVVVVVAITYWVGITKFLAT